jgi:uncharacterized membrane protein
MRRSELSDRRLAALASLVLFSALGAGLVAVRAAYTASPEGIGLVWNLFLAWVPFAFALAVYDGHRRGTRRAVLVGGAVLWLLFFPNAPYIVTDFKYLDVWSGAPIWFDVVVLSTFAWAGLVLGFLSLYLMQAVARSVVGAVNAWFGALAVLALSSFGIYLGRFQRWNSWDIFVRPRSLLGGALEDLVAGPKPLAVTLLFTAFLTTAYLVFYAFFRLAQIERS